MSVHNQTYKNYEHLIIDGGSTDGTLDAIRSLSLDNVRIISEPDDGIWDAFNKGLKNAKGEIIGFLNSDDYFHNERVLELIAKEFMGGANVVYGNLRYISADKNKIIRKWESQKFKPMLIKHGWMPPHPSFYFKKDKKSSNILFDKSLKVSSDYKFILEVISNQDYKIKHVPNIFVDMRWGGNSNGSLKNILLKMKEDYSILSRYTNFPIFGLLIKNLSKINQFIK